MGNPEWHHRSVDLDRNGAPDTSLRSPSHRSGDLPPERERWRARELRSHKHGVVRIAGVQVLDPPSVEVELLRSPEPLDLLATQVLFLRSLGFPLPEVSMARLSALQRERVTLIYERVQDLERLYPDITR